MSDECFDQQIHDAYEHVELSDAAQERILANLLAMQNERGLAKEGQQNDGAELGEKQAAKAEVVPFRGRRWQWALPLAAVLLAAAVVVRVMNTPQQYSRMSSGEALQVARESAATETTEESGEEAAAGALAESNDSADSADAGAFNEDALNEDAAGASVADAGAADAGGVVEAASLANAYPRVELSDGTEFLVSFEGDNPVEVSADQVGDFVGAGHAFSNSNETAGPSCEVYVQVGIPDMYAVRYAGEEAYWLCVVGAQS